MSLKLRRLFSDKISTIDLDSITPNSGAILTITRILIGLLHQQKNYLFQITPLTFTQLALALEIQKTLAKLYQRLIEF